MIGKYADHLPLYRREQIYQQRHKVELSRQTMANSVALVSDWFRPIVEAMAAERFVDGYVQIDETPIQYLAPGTRHRRTAQAYRWMARRPGGDTVCHWNAGRGHQCLENIISHDFTRTIQCNACGDYGTYTRK